MILPLSSRQPPAPQRAIAENAAGLFAPYHPMIALLPGGEAYTQGCLALLSELGRALAEITGMDEVTTQPLAGAHGEMTGMLLVAAYHRATSTSAGARRRPK